MFRLFIVDDNKYERLGIQSSMDWSALGIEVVGAFANGEEALANVERLKPDLIVTDIAMPRMNGIALAERMRELHPEVKIVFTSCHSDFDFAKSAVSLGVYGYVLKPIIADELEKAVSGILQEMTERERTERERAGMLRQLEGMLPLVQEQFFKELLLGNFRNEEDIRERIDFLRVPVPEDSGFAVLALEVKEPGGTANPSSRSAVDSYYQSYTIKKAIQALGQEASSDQAAYPASGQATVPVASAYPVQMAGDSFAVLLFGDPGSFLETAVGLHTTLAGRLDKPMTIGVSQSSSALAETAELYRQAREAAMTTYYEDGSPIIVYEEIEDRSARGPFDTMPSLDSVYGDVKALLSYGGDDAVDAFLDTYLVPRRSGASDENYVKAFVFLTLNLTSMLLAESGKSFQELLGEEPAVWGNVDRLASAPEARALLRRIFQSLRDQLAERNPTKNAIIADQIRDMIGRRYGEPLTIEDISKSVYLSGRHANHIFKKETGQTIFDYLIEYRIGIAKQLLADPQSKVSSIAEEVGYLNTSYFCLAFKKNVGMTPAEYKNKFKSMLR
ncbi:response regulator [Cohnella sp. GCM10027633]|uniref:response regulator transcription factor n=1 Tax=unclassified Cohnella TaxID=2636738 RepID=UPI0036412D2B